MYTYSFLRIIIIVDVVECKTLNCTNSCSANKIKYTLFDDNSGLC